MSKFGNALKGAYYTTVNAAKNNSHTIFAVVGVVSMAAGAVFAVKESYKAHEVIEEAKEKFAEIKEAEEKHSDVYSHEDCIRDKTLVCRNAAIGLGKTIGPVALLEAAGAFFVFKGNSSACKKIAGLAADAEGLRRAFKAYREHVIEDQGERKDSEYMFGKNAQEEHRLKVTEIENDNTVDPDKEIVDKSLDRAGLSPYARFVYHIKGREHLKENPYYLMKFLREVEDDANTLLRCHRKLTLNEVYRLVGEEESVAGAYVGWTYDPNGMNPNGDNHVDLGLDKAFNDRFAQCIEPVAIIDPNVDMVPLTSSKSLAYKRQY